MLQRLIRVLLSTIVLCTGATRSSAQCTTANINWDNLDYLVSTGNYSGHVTATQAQNQKFAIGVDYLTIALSANIGLGANGTHTGNLAGYTGNDVQYSPTSNGQTITLTFSSEVSNVSFVLYDVDKQAVFNITAADAASGAENVTVTPQGSTILTIAGTATNRKITASNSDEPNSGNKASATVSVAGPVKKIVITLTTIGGDEDFWLSDITACVTGSFPNNYYIVSKPFTGQPGYVLTMVDDSVYYTNPANGVSKLLFTDPGNKYLNSLGYDPYNRIVYYTYSLSATPSTDKALKKYDLNTKTISTVLADITTLGIPVFDYGVESGSAGFYNGQLYLGIEGYSSNFKSNRKAIVWRIDFTGSTPTNAVQVYASAADDGSGNIKHDWSDIGCSNGMLYDFDGAAGDEDFNVYNMQTGAVTNYTPASGIVGRQVGIGWDEKIYNIDGTITQYNGTNGHTGTTYTITSTPAIPANLSWGDAGEAYRPFVDYGDAPASYDPVAGDPAVHDSSGTTLRIGASFNIEGAKRGVTSTEDGFDDGLATVPFMPPGSGNFLAQVSVFNNTGSAATICAWLDYNGNGVFDASEGISVSLASSASSQLKYLYWPSISTPLVNGSITYLRIRVTSTSNGMTTANPTGYYSNGEVEDYKIRVDNYPLAVSMISFDAKAINNNKVKLNWSANEEANFIAYEIQRSKNGTDWDHLEFVDASHSTGIKNYEITDYSPLKGISYYRLKLGDDNGMTKYSAIKMVTINDLAALVSITPNPATDHATINIFNNDVQATASIRISNMQGNELLSKKAILKQGANPVDLPLPAWWPAGIYVVQVWKGEEVTNKKLMINR